MQSHPVEWFCQNLAVSVGSRRGRLGLRLTHCFSCWTESSQRGPGRLSDVRRRLGKSPTPKRGPRSAGTRARLCVNGASETSVGHTRLPRNNAKGQNQLGVLSPFPGFCGQQHQQVRFVGLQGKLRSLNECVIWREKFLGLNTRRKNLPLVSL